MPFSTIDMIELAWFVLTWTGYAIHVEYIPKKRLSLNATMNSYREIWMRRMLAREARMVDMQVMAALQNGTAFFASTSLFAIGGALTVLRSTDEMLNVIATLPIGIQTTRTLWEIKAIGLAVVFVYAFFKFAWSYRLFNYVVILLGATPPPNIGVTRPTAQARVTRFDYNPVTGILANALTVATNTDGKALIGLGFHATNLYVTFNYGGSRTVRPGDGRLARFFNANSNGVYQSRHDIVYGIDKGDHDLDMIKIKHLIIKSLECTFRDSNQPDREIEAREPGGSFDKMLQMIEVAFDIGTYANPPYSGNKANSGVRLNHTCSFSKKVRSMYAENL